MNLVVFCLIGSALARIEFDYKEVLRLSLIFYESQRSGRLPQNNRVPWRGDSALDDRGINGEDLTGGYYDGELPQNSTHSKILYLELTSPTASDYVKFGFTMAFTTTLLSWGVLVYEDAYRETGQHQNALDAIKWSTDYFIKCHVSKYELYGQVGDFTIDHKFWGRPEDMNMSRPAYKIDKDQPGSDLAAETSAALAAASLVFKSTNVSYSEVTLRHAEELFDFAVKYRGLYDEVIPGAKSFLRSSGYGDELTWASLWLYKATKNSKYLTQAEDLYVTFTLGDRPNEFFYNKKNAGVQVLLAEETQRPEYREAVKNFCDYSREDQKRTPKHLVYIDKVGTLSHAANIAFICLQGARLGISPKLYVEFAQEQIEYMLGASGRSYVVGYGENYPKKPHHSASSCPDRPQRCNWEQYTTKEANPQILYGALVSGPDQIDQYQDIREEYLYNEVTLDYNAGFQGAIAGLIHHLK